MGRRTQTIPPAATPPDPVIQPPITTYDTLGRVKRVTQPDDNTYTEFTYDKGGRRTRVRDPLGRITEYFHDSTYRAAPSLKPPRRGRCWR
jgi:YD repeat-containing protein